LGQAAFNIYSAYTISELRRYTDDTFLAIANNLTDLNKDSDDFKYVLIEMNRTVQNHDGIIKVLVQEHYPGSDVEPTPH
jgi:hypothetical protein